MRDLDYYSFGMIMPGREFSIGGYRFGFNGKENDNEVKGITGSQQDYGMRIYDPRLGKFLSIDPDAKQYPWNSPYNFAENKPIEGVDVDGRGFGEMVDAVANAAYTTYCFVKQTYADVSNKINTAVDNAMTKVENKVYDKYKAGEKSPVGRAMASANTNYDKVKITLSVEGKDDKVSSAKGKLIEASWENQYPNGDIATRDKVYLIGKDGVKFDGTRKLPGNVSLKGEADTKGTTAGKGSVTPNLEIGFSSAKVFVKSEFDTSGNLNTTYGYKLGVDKKIGPIKVEFSVEGGKTSDKITK